jgi:hypothetical protein
MQRSPTAPRFRYGHLQHRDPCALAAADGTGLVVDPHPRACRQIKASLLRGRCSTHQNFAPSQNAKAIEIRRAAPAMTPGRSLPAFGAPGMQDTGRVQLNKRANPSPAQQGQHVAIVKPRLWFAPECGPQAASLAITACAKVCLDPAAQSNSRPGSASCSITTTRAPIGPPPARSKRPDPTDNRKIEKSFRIGRLPRRAQRAARPAALRMNCS